MKYEDKHEMTKNPMKIKENSIQATKDVIWEEKSLESIESVLSQKSNNYVK